MDNIDDSELLSLLENHLNLEEVKYEDIKPEPPVSPKKRKGRKNKVETPNDSMTKDDIIKAISLIDNCLSIIKHQCDKLLDVEYRLCIYKNDLFHAKIERPFCPPSYELRKYQCLYTAFLNSFKSPYFKDSFNFQAPRNSDCYDRIDKFKTFVPWTENDVELLSNCVRKLIIKTYITTLNPDTDYSSKVDCLKTIDYFHNKPLKDFLTDEMEKNIDWLTISDIMKRKFTPVECKNMWNLYASPKINKEKWKKSEVSKLKLIAKNHKYQSWDEIAKELGTSRTGYLCFLYYVKCIYSDNKGPWTQTECDFLKEVVEKSTYGTKICWHKVIYYMENRNFKQIFQKWTYGLNPMIKKGSFGKKEDELLLTLKHRFNIDVSDMDKFIKNRTHKQIKERYEQTLNQNEKIKIGEWTEEEDTQLLNLVDVMGEKWVDIATQMGSRSRVQVRHRYNRLIQKFAANPNINLSEINRPKRPGNKKYIEKTKKFINRISKKSKPIFKKSEFNKYMKSVKKEKKRKTSSGIDQKLVGYFQDQNFDSFKKKPHINATNKNIISATHQILQMLKPNLNITEERLFSLLNDSSLSKSEIELLLDPNFMNKVKGTSSLHNQSEIELLPPNLDTLYGLWKALETLRHESKTNFDIPGLEELEDTHKRALIRWYQRLHTIFTWPCVLSDSNVTKEDTDES